MSRLALLPALAPFFALAACSSADDEAGPPPVTQEEAEALEDAASMLDEQRLPAEQAEPLADDVTEGESE